MFRWLSIALIGIIASLCASDYLKMPTTFDYTKVEHETVLTPTLSMLGGEQDC